MLLSSRGMNRYVGLTIVLALGCAIWPALGQMRITEYMYNGVGGEFIEFTNTGSQGINMTGWSYDDDSAISGTVDLSAFGYVAPGESVILAEDSVESFLTTWGLTDVTVIGENATANLGRNDQINLFDATGTLVDRLTYGDEDFPGSIRANGASGWVCAQALGADDPYAWMLSTAGDQQSSYLSLSGDTGNPGEYTAYVCPADPTGACCAAGVCAVTTEAECVGIGLWQGAGTNCQTTQCPPPTNAQVRITEYMYAGVVGEFIEFTNLAAEPVDMTGWSFDDDSRVPGEVDLSGFGAIASGASVILTEATAAAFQADWHGLAGVAIVGDLIVNLGGADEINLYDNSGALVDRLTYGGGAFPGSVVASGASGWPCEAGIGTNDIYQWLLAGVGDAQGSVLSVSGDVGNPGLFVVSDCPFGSCCVAGQCADLSLGDCTLGHGLFLGDGTNCATDPCPAPSDAEVRITEYMYGGLGGEFIEFTNLGDAPVDMTGWSFTDNADLPGEVDLSAFLSVAPGESVVLAENLSGDPTYSFVLDWGLTGTSVITIPVGLLSRNDWISLYDSSGSLVDRLQFGDEDFPGSIRTQYFSGWPCRSGIGQNDIYDWALAATGDVQGSFVSSRGDTGSPGSYVPDCCGQAEPGDFDCDGDVDLEDFLTLDACLHGPGVLNAPICRQTDLDIDDDTDLADVNTFQRLFTGG